MKYKERRVQEGLHGHEGNAVLLGGLQGHVEEVTFGLGLHKWVEFLHAEKIRKGIWG